MRFSPRRAADALGVTPEGPAELLDLDLRGVSFDSRSLRPDQLFVPIVGDRDGHEFVRSAVDGGARAFLTARPADQLELGDRLRDVVAIPVDDTLRALLDLGRWGRAAWADRVPGATVVGITGSVGKTSTKDLAAAALAPGARTWVNERSFNNDQGLPTTILGAPDDTQVMVLEMGMRGFGEIARLVEVAEPRVGVVTRVAEAHGERVGGIEGVARAKAELVERLPDDGVAILNGDDPHVRSMAERTSARVVLFGTRADCDVRIESLSLDALARPSFTAVTWWGTFGVTLAVSGEHMAHNAAAALAVAGVLGHDMRLASDALATARLSSMRMEVGRLTTGAILLNDAYNANPTSMRAALDALAALHATRRIAVLGVMAEIDDPEREHQAIAERAASLGVELIAVGTDAYGVAPVGIDEVTERLGSLAGGDAVLVKASRAAGLERVAVRVAELGGGLVVEGDDVAS